MYEEFQKSVIADAAIVGLDTMHARFLNELTSASERVVEPDLGLLNVENSSITFVCHGHMFAVGCRPIAVNGEISALEYDFVTDWKNEKLSVLRLYLQPNEQLTYDASGKLKLSDFNNTYIKNRILSALSAALLASPIFAPAHP